VCFIDGEYTVKRIEVGEGRLRLMPANEKNTAYQPIEVTEDNNFMVWGVVTYVIKKM
jgi:DNA polymerase V